MAEVICHQCGEKNSPDSQFCFSCEAFLAWEGTAEIAARAALARGGQVAARRIEAAPDAAGADPENPLPLPPAPLPVSGPEHRARQPADAPAPAPGDPGATVLLPPAALKVLVEPREITLLPGGDPVSIQVHIFNLSRIVDAYSVSIDRGPRWLQGSAAEVRLLPGTAEKVPLTVNIPHGRLVFAQSVRLPIWVRSQSNAAVGFQIWVNITVPIIESPVDVQLEPSLIRARPGGDGVCQALVDNRAGNGPLKIVFAGNDPEKSITFTFAPPVLDVAPGTLASCRIRLRAPAPEPGHTFNRAFTVTGTAGARIFPATGTLVQSSAALAVDAPISIRIEPGVIRVVDSETGVFSAVIDNRGGTRWVRVGLSASDPEQSLTFSFAPSVLDVPPGRQIWTQVRVWGAAPVPGKELSRQFTLHGVDGKAEFSTTATFFQISSPPAISQVTMKLDPAIVRLTDHGSGQFLLVADNRDGTRPVRLQLWGQDPERAIHFTCRPDILEVPAGGAATAQILAIAPIPEPNQEITRQLTIIGTDGIKTVEATGTMIITTSAPAIEAVSIRLDPTIARSPDGRIGFFQAVVDNRSGHHPVRVYLGGDDPENVIGFVITPAVLDIGPGQLATAQVRVEAPRPAAGQEVTRQLTVLASDGYREVSTPGSLVQQAPARTPIGWLLFTLGGGLMMIIGVFLPWVSGQPQFDGLDWNLPRLAETFNFRITLMEQIAPLISVGAVVALLGLVVILGLTGKGRLTRAASLLGAVAIIGFVVALAVSGVSATPLIGAFAVLLGGVLGFIGGLLKRR